MKKVLFMAILIAAGCAPVEENPKENPEVTNSIYTIQVGMRLALRACDLEYNVKNQTRPTSAYPPLGCLNYIELARTEIERIKKSARLDSTRKDLEKYTRRLQSQYWKIKGEEACLYIPDATNKQIIDCLEERRLWPDDLY